MTLLNWKESTQTTLLASRSPAFDSQEQKKPRKPAPKQRTAEVTAIAHTRLSNANIAYNQTQCSRYYIHRRSTTALLHHSTLDCAPSLIIVLFFVIIIIVFFFFFFSFLFVNFFSLRLVGVGHFVAPVVVVAAAAFFPPVHRSYLTTAS
jgi:hypothetical protein